MGCMYCHTNGKNALFLPELSFFCVHTYTAELRQSNRMERKLQIAEGKQRSPRVWQRTPYTLLLEKVGDQIAADERFQHIYTHIYNIVTELIWTLFFTYSLFYVLSLIVI